MGYSWGEVHTLKALTTPVESGDCQARDAVTKKPCVLDVVHVALGSSGHLYRDEVGNLIPFVAVEEE